MDCPALERREIKQLKRLNRLGSRALLGMTIGLNPRIVLTRMNQPKSV